MPTRSNKHIKKYNQLVEVYELSDLEPMELVDSRETAYLERRTAETAERRERVEGLTAEDFFDERRRTEIRETESLPTPAAVADPQREELLDRLSAIEDALDERIANDTELDTADDLGF